MTLVPALPESSVASVCWRDTQVLAAGYLKASLVLEHRNAWSLGSFDGACRPRQVSCLPPTHLRRPPTQVEGLALTRTHQNGSIMVLLYPDGRTALCGCRSLSVIHSHKTKWKLRIFFESM
eukprot:4317628-Amphidinium_carterae.1